MEQINLWTLNKLFRPYGSVPGITHGNELELQ